MSTTKALVGYGLAFPSGDIPPNAYGGLYNYTFAGNGTFITAKREGLSLRIQISEHEVRGLRRLDSVVKIELPRVPYGMVQKMLNHSRSVCVSAGAPVEALFHVSQFDDGWILDIPEQQATGSSVKPVDDGPDSSYSRALIEVHSHHQMEAFFSSQDDADEQGFRIYGVLGEIFTKPKIRVRVGCYGNFQEIPAGQVFDLPAELSDAYGIES